MPTRNLGIPSNNRPIRIGLKIDAENFGSMLHETEMRAENLAPWLHGSWVPFVRQLFADQLRTQGRAMGVGSLWRVPYSALYKRYKARYAKHNLRKKEVFYGAMFASLLFNNGSSIEIVGPHGAMVGSEAISDRNFNYPGVQQSAYPDSLRGTPTRLGMHKPGARKRRPSEKAVEKKRKIPPRPPWGYFKKRWGSSLNISLLEYIATGRIEVISR